MSLYILPENQKLIWESINKIPVFQSFTGDQEEWFREIIQQFYESNKFKLLSVQELQQLNRDTISYMIQALKDFSAVQPAPSSAFGGVGVGTGAGGSIFGTSISPAVKSVLKFPSNVAESKAVTRDYFSEKKQEEVNRQFASRQSDYGEMLKRAPQQDIDFRLSAEDDGPIENIDAIVKHYTDQRNSEMNAYMQNGQGLGQDIVPSSELGIIDLAKPASFGQQSQPASFGQQVQSQPASFGQQVQSQPASFGQQVQSQPASFGQQVRTPYYNPQKNVHWSETIDRTIEPPASQRQSSNTRNDMGIFTEFVDEIKGVVQTMREEIEYLKRTNSQVKPVQGILRTQSDSDVDSQNPLVSTILSRLRRNYDSPTNPQYSSNSNS